MWLHGRRIARKPNTSPLVVLATYLTVFACFASNAPADSTVTGNYNQVVFRGDGSPHDIVVRLSDRNVTKTTISSEEPTSEHFNAQASAADQALGLQLGLYAARSDDAERYAIDDLAEVQVTADAALQTLESGGSNGAGSGTATSDFDQFLERLKAAIKNTRKAAGSEKLIVEAGQTARDNVFQALNAIEVAEQRGQVVTRAMLDAAEEAQKLLSGVQATYAEAHMAFSVARTAMVDAIREAAEAATTPEQLAALKELRTAANRAGRLGRYHKIAAAKIGLLATLIAFTYLFWADAAGASIEQHVVIQDRSGAPIEPKDDGCRHKVRDVDGGEIPNAVECNVPEALTLWGYLYQLFDIQTIVSGEIVAPYTGIFVNTGDAPDTVDVRLPADKRIGVVAVLTGAARDQVRIEPESLAPSGKVSWNAWVVGGPGPDLVFTGDEDDEVIGDNLAGTSSSGDDDRIATAGGADSIRAGAGNNLVLAGKGPDYLSARSGSSVLVGGEGPDQFQGDGGNLLVVSRELFGAQAEDEVDCGPGTSLAYVDPTPDSSQESEDTRCDDGSPPSAPTGTSVGLAFLKDPPPDGHWPWFG